MSAIFERLLDLIRKTGDKVVFYDSSKEEAFVVMNIKDYENMTTEGKSRSGLTEEKVSDRIDTINQEIAIWHEEEKKTEAPPPVDLPVEKKPEEEESQFYFEPVE